MVDHRFIATTDVLSTLDTGQTCGAVTGGVEALITISSLRWIGDTADQASRMAALICVAWDMRPIVGGKVIVQAKPLQEHRWS